MDTALQTRSESDTTLHANAGKLILVNSLLAAKEASGKTFTQISKEIGLTNAFTAQIFYGQVCLTAVDPVMQSVLQSFILLGACC